MKIKDLISELNKFDPETSVTVGCSIESGRSFSCVLHNGDLSIEEYDNEKIKEEIENVVTEDTQDEYNEIVNSLSEKVVVINISGVSDIWE
jgi:basic membrane lipoprotein Med (substrate-binding protein (PBP1-ABC) superfamily)